MIDQSQLVGTWKFVSWTKEFTETGERVDALGPNPFGYISYASDGRMYAIAVRGDRQAPENTPSTEAEKLALFDTMLAYAGRYVLHDDHVVHHIDTSWNQTWTGSEQLRFMTLTETTLDLTSPPAPDPFTGKTVIHRISFQRWER